MRSWISRGQCQKCRAQEVIAHRERQHVCKQCDPHLFAEISAEQKNRFLATGSVHEKRMQK